MSDPSRCGPHAQIAHNERVRISQCACGSYHVTFVQKGVTVQLGLEDVRAISEAMGVALRVAEAEDRGRSIAASGTGSTINLRPPRMDASGERVSLPDGEIRIRPIRADDREQLLEGFARLSATSRYRRFLGAMRLTEDDARYLSEVDGRDHVALVASVETPDLKDERGIGVARYVRLVDERDTAEAAITVLDDHQRRGVGAALARALHAAALENGVRAFRAEVLASNEPMLAILRAAHAVERERSDDTIVFDIPLAAHDEAGGGAGRAIAIFLRAAAETAAFVARKLRHFGQG